MLTYSAKLKIRSSGKANFNLYIADRVNDLLGIMNLVQCKNRVISEYPVLRGEQGSDLRRLSIALEIIDMPPLLVMDEPTLDFDPAFSVSIMQCLQTLASRGHAVVISMKKPYIQEMVLLDRVCLLSEGHSIFCASPKLIEAHFCSPQMGYELKKDVDIVQFILDIAGGIERPKLQREADLPSVMQENFETSEFFESPLPCRPNGPGEVNCSAFPDSFFRFGGIFRFISPGRLQLYRTGVLIQRAVYTKLRDKEILKKSIGACVLLGLFCGYLQWNMGSYGCCTVNLLHFPYLNTANLSSLMFFMTMFTFAFPFVNVHVITQELQLFRYEQAAGVCTIPQFALSLAFSEIPFLILYLMIFLNIIYWMATFGYGTDNYQFFMSTYIMNGIIGLLCAVQWGAMLKKELMVRDFFYLILTFMALVSGFPFQLTTMTGYLAKVAVINPLRWTFEGAMAWYFDRYEDGSTWLEPFKFENFHHNDVHSIQINFLLVTIALIVVFLIPFPVTLRRIERADGAPRSRNESSFSGRDSIDGTEKLPGAETPRLQTRHSELAKPLLFMRDTSVTGRASKLSVNLSQVGEENAEHGPTVLFKDITYVVRDTTSPIGTKTVLSRVSGQFDWGKLSMIMGAPESGKSSLLHILGGDVSALSDYTGKILYNNRAPDPSVPLWQRCGLVSVQGQHNRDLTVQEVLTFAMKLRCHNRHGLKVVDENVGRTVENMHLFDVLHKRTKSLSPGELKRLSIAEEMVHGPKLLLIDEPTTGVNPIESSHLMLTFREMVNQDRTVIAAMSQPSKEIFTLFDTLMLLSKGRVIYFGPIKQSTMFFKNSPFQFNTQNYTNPAEFLADISGGFISDSKGDFIDSSLLENYYMSTDKYTNLRLKFKPELFKGVTNTLSTNPLQKQSSNSDDDDSGASMDYQSGDIPLEPQVSKPLPLPVLALMELGKELCQMPSWAKFDNFIFKGQILLHRSAAALFRRYEIIFESMVTHIVLACLFGWIMGNSKGVDRVYNMVSFFAMSSMFLIFLNIQFIFFMFNSRQVFLKEHARDLYSNFNFWMVHSYPMYLLRCINGLVFILVAWDIIKQTHESAKYTYAILSYVLMVLSGAVMSEAVVFMSDDKRLCYTAIPGLAFVQFMFSGLFIKSGSLPQWLAPWTPSISMIRWMMQGNYISLYYNTNVFPVLPNGYSTYTSFLVLFSWGGKSDWYCLYRLLIFLAVFRVCSLLASGYAARKQKTAQRGKRVRDD